jgi:hypothetical protein
MAFSIPLSAETLACIKDNQPLFSHLHNKSQLTLAILKECLITEEETSFADLQLTTFLLKDLLHAVQRNKDNKLGFLEEGPSSSLITLLAALGFAGLVNFCMWGFDGVISVLQLFTSNPLLLYLPGAFFAFIAGLIFISFDFTQAAKELGVDYFEFSSRVNDYIEQDKLIKHLLRSLDLELLSRTTLSQQEQTCLFALLKQQAERLASQKKRLRSSGNDPFVERAEKISSCLCGFLYFFDGFFCGQAGAMFLLGVSSIGAGMASPLGAFLMIGLGLISAIGAASFYCLVQKKSVEYLVSAALGVNKEKIEEFCKSSRETAIEKELSFRAGLLRLVHKKGVNDGLKDEPNGSQGSVRRHAKNTTGFFHRSILKNNGACSAPNPRRRLSF